MRPRPFDDEVGDLGWPCPSGAALLLQIAHLNCIVFYYPLKPTVTFSTRRIVNAFQQAIAHCTSPENAPRLHYATAPPLVLTELAASFHRFAQQIRSSENETAVDIDRAFFRIMTFKAVLFIPICPPHFLTGPTAEGVPLSSHAGLSSGIGHIALSSFEVPMRRATPDMPSNAVQLLVVAAIPLPGHVSG